MTDAAPCPCTGVTLGADLQQRLRQRYTGCLCNSCLNALTAGDALEAAASPSSPPPG